MNSLYKGREGALGTQRDDIKQQKKLSNFGVGWGEGTRDKLRGRVFKQLDPIYFLG